jgi:hypothetical protein
MNALQQTKWFNLCPPATLVDNASLTVTELDTKGWDYAQIFVFLGATDIAMSALAVTESDTTGSGHDNVTGLIYGTSTDIDGSTSALPTATDDNGIFLFEIDLRGRKRYLDLTATVGDGTAGGYYMVGAILSRGESPPTSVSGRGLDGCVRV